MARKAGAIAPNAGAMAHDADAMRLKAGLMLFAGVRPASYNPPVDLQSYFTETNHLMRETLRKLARAKRSAPVTGPLETYAEVVLSDLVAHDRCVYLEALLPRDVVATPFAPSDYLPNRSCLEQSVNRVELGSDISAKECGPGLVEHGIAVAEIIRLKLQLSYPRRRFRIRVFWNARPLFQTRRDYELTRKCGVSFWTIRRGDRVFAPIEGFKHEAVGELVVTGQATRRKNI